MITDSDKDIKQALCKLSELRLSFEKQRQEKSKCTDNPNYLYCERWPFEFREWVRRRYNPFTGGPETHYTHYVWITRKHDADVEFNSLVEYMKQHYDLSLISCLS